MGHKVRRRTRGLTVPAIVGLLLASAILRLGTGANAAFAVDTELESGETALPTCSPEDTPAALLEALQAREARLAGRETQFEERLQALRLIESDVAAKLAALEAAEQSLAELIALSETAAEDDLTRLTSVYENMKPEDAAALFEEMDAAFAAGFIGRMQPDAAALLLSKLEPETAHLISVILAGRNAGAPTE